MGWMDKIKSYFSKEPLADGEKGFVPWTGPTASFSMAVSARELAGEAYDSVKSPYKENPWFYAGVKAIARNAAQVPLKVFSVRSNEDLPLDPFQILLDRPNPHMTGSFFLETLVTHYHTAGAFAFMLETKADRMIRPGETPAELWPLNPNKLTPTIENNVIVGWEYESEGGKMAIPAHALVWGRQIDPDDPYFTGLTPAVPASFNINNDTLSARHRTSTVRNGAVPDGILSSADKLVPEQVKRLREAWEARHKGASKASRTAILEAGMSYQRIQLTPAELTSEYAQKGDRDAILATLGVPKFMVTLYEDVNLATAREARKTFWGDTVIPIHNTVLEAIQTVPHASGVDIYFDYSEVEALQQSLSEKLKQAQALKDLGYSLNDINERLDLGMPQVSATPSDTAPKSEKCATTSDLLGSVQILSTPGSSSIDPVYEVRGGVSATQVHSCVPDADTVDQVFNKMKRRLFEARSGLLRGDDAGDVFTAATAAIRKDVGKILGEKYKGDRLAQVMQYIKETIEASSHEDVKSIMNAATPRLRAVAEAEVMEVA